MKLLILSFIRANCGLKTLRKLGKVQHREIMQHQVDHFSTTETDFHLAMKPEIREQKQKQKKQNNICQIL